MLPKKIKLASTTLFLSLFLSQGVKGQDVAAQTIEQTNSTIKSSVANTIEDCGAMYQDCLKNKDKSCENPFSHCTSCVGILKGSFQGENTLENGILKSIDYICTTTKPQ